MRGVKCGFCILTGIETMDQKSIDSNWMAEVIALAEKGAGRTSPNPMVGAIVVKHGREIGRGYHEQAGGPHAEVVALKDAGREAAGATLYVNLEPCAHWGKTPPCVKAILEAGIATVVCAMEDPNPRVQGEGIRHLRANGVGVRVGALKRQAMRQNEAHVKFAVTGRPLVTLKIAQTLDGKIASVGGQGERISGPEAEKFVHMLRARYDAVLVGKNTVLQDDPQLTVRAIEGRDPLRLILDSWAKIPPSAHVFTANDDRKTVRITLAIGRRPVTAPRPDCFDWYVPPDDRHQIDLHEVLERAATNNITSILVEGGAQIFGSFIREAGVSTFGRWKVNSLAEAVRLIDSDVCWLGQDLLITGYPDYDAEDRFSEPVEEETEHEDREADAPESFMGEFTTDRSAT
jgi:diaminohydroxyphosphoribosylaminopyrimidine deaminase/5-amino-6-(5-phosphoribosylamino)uracil reductase